MRARQISGETVANQCLMNPIGFAVGYYVRPFKLPVCLVTLGCPEREDGKQRPARSGLLLVKCCLLSNRHEARCRKWANIDGGMFPRRKSKAARAEHHLHTVDVDTCHSRAPHVKGNGSKPT